MITIDDLNEKSMLDNLLKRFGANLIYVRAVHALLGRLLRSLVCARLQIRAINVFRVFSRVSVFSRCGERGLCIVS